MYSRVVTFPIQLAASDVGVHRRNSPPALVWGRVAHDLNLGTFYQIRFSHFAQLRTEGFDGRWLS